MRGGDNLITSVETRFSAATKPPGRRRISIVTPCFNEQDNVRACCEAVRDVFATRLPAYDYEHIFADNASTDDTAQRLRELARCDPRVKVILNARNFKALPSAFNAVLSASGDAVVPLLAADLQDPPEVIPEFVREWEQGCKVVYGIRRERDEFFAVRMLRHAFYVLIAKFSDTPLRVDAGEFQLLDRVVVETLRTFDEREPYLRGMIAHCGFRSAEVPYVMRARRKGRSKATLFGLFDLAMTAFVAFSNVPIRLCLLTGFALAIGSLFYAFLQLALALLFPRAGAGVPTLIIGLFFLGGVQLLFLGVLGEYISAIHVQVRKRPMVVEAERINFAAEQRAQSECAPRVQQDAADDARSAQSAAITDAAS